MALIALLFAALEASCPAQVIDLSAAAPEARTPPPLDEFSFAAQLGGQLQREVAALLIEERQADPVRASVLRAGLTLRIIAADLLRLADEAGEAGNIAFLHGFTLAAGRSDLDAAASRALELRDRAAAAPPETRADLEDRLHRSLAALHRFNEQAVDQFDLSRTADPDRLDRNLPAVFAPLVEGLAPLLGLGVVDHWIAADAARAGDEEPPAAPPSVAEALAARIDSAELPPPSRAALDPILDFIRRGEAFPDLRPHVEAYRPLLENAIDFAAMLNRADWLDAAARDGYALRLHEALALFRERATREEGERRLARLHATREALGRLDALRRSDRKLDLCPLVAAVLAADARVDHAAEADLGREQLRRIGLVVDRMLALRALEPDTLAREHRALAERLSRGCRAAEGRLIAEIGRLAADPGALADPAFATLMLDLVQHVEDLERVRRFGSWTEAVRLIRASAAGPFAAQLRRMASWLIDPGRRPDAVLALDRFELQLARFRALPFEHELRTGAPEAAAAAGGLHARLVSAIDARRVEWIEAWAEGKADAAPAARLHALHRLTLALADSTAFRDLAARAASLNRWSAWELGPEALASGITEVPARLKLATVAAIDGADAALDRELGAIERSSPLPRLAARLEAVLREPLASRPFGATAALGQVMHGPGPGAWRVGRRAELARLCRYAMERWHAAGSGRPDAAARLGLFVDAQARRLLDSI
jgi:hypothetical protein